MDWRVADEKRFPSCFLPQETSEAERRRIGSEFERLRRLLDEKERAVLQRLAELDAAFEAAQAEKASRVAEEIARLHGLIGQLEAGRLPQVRLLLTRMKTKPLKNHTRVDNRVQDPELRFGADNWVQILELRLVTEPPSVPTASVTLDPATAHPQILVSPDGRSARRRQTPRDPPPGSSERFEALRCVLGRQGFAAGRHRWAVEVLPGSDWALGVAREFVPRKGCFGLSPARGVWAVGQWLGQLRALTWPSPTCLPLARVPKRIEVALDYGGGRVAFRDADSEAEIFAFPPAAFAGERLRPLLWLGEGPALLTFCP
uniref:B30.2/SPRY domain-containing protein n=1 Tax=Cairina moschata TaxID=8855 RepID=A0A8C3BNV5_CAIMO